MVQEARLEEVGSGLAPVSPGWFVVNVGEAAWVHNDDFGGRCVFESSSASCRAAGARAADVRAARLHAGRARARQADRDVPRRVGPGGLPRARGHLLVDRRGGGARAQGLGLRPLPAGHAPHLRRHRRRAVRDLHDRRTSGGRHDRLSGLGDGAGPRRRRRDRDEHPARGVRAVRPVAPRPARARGRDCLGGRHDGATDGQRRHRGRIPRCRHLFFRRARPGARRASHDRRRVGRARHRTGRPARRDRHDAHARRPQPARALAISHAACRRRSPERPGERARLPTRHVRRGRHRRDARPAPQARRAARRRSGRSTRTRIGSATSAAPKGCSSGSPSNSAG